MPARSVLFASIKKYNGKEEALVPSSEFL